MTVFSDEQMHRPLFEEPTPAIERRDTRDKPHGFLVGGGANLSRQHLGQQYYDAAHLLVESIKHQDWEGSPLANPVLYLYRHSVELFLKAAMGEAAKTHSLDRLADEFAAFVKKRFDADVPEWIVARMRELGTIDPNSTAFRYSQNYDKSARRDVPIGREYHIDLLHLESAMMALNVALVGVIAAVGCGEDIRAA